MNPAVYGWYYYDFIRYFTSSLIAFSDDSIYLNELLYFGYSIFDALWALVIGLEIVLAIFVIEPT